MTVDRATLVRVAAGIREDMAATEAIIDILSECVTRFSGRMPDRIELHGVGGFLHDLYNTIESAIERVSPVLNGHIPAGENWHRELLRSAALDLPGIRPPVLSPGNAMALEEFLRFRHRYRHMYAWNLDWDRVSALVAKARPLWQAVRADLERFLAFLDGAASSIPDA